MVGNRNSNKMLEDPNVAPYWCVGLGALGGVAKYLADRDKNGKFDWIDFFSSMLMSALLGLIVCMSAHAYGLSYEWCGALSGMSGLLGKELVKLTLSFLRNKLGIHE